MQDCDTQCLAAEVQQALQLESTQMYQMSRQLRWWHSNQSCYKARLKVMHMLDNGNRQSQLHQSSLASDWLTVVSRAADSMRAYRTGHSPFSQTTGCPSPPLWQLAQ